jgi:hypothetical protein
MAEDEDLTPVDQSGPAVAHRGEQIVGAPDSDAVLTTDAGGDVHYHFPIHVVVVGEHSEDAKSEIEASIMSSLFSALT